MQKITIFYNPNKPEAPASAKALAQVLESEGVKVKIAPTQLTNVNWGDLYSDTNLAVVMGGDGTFLRASKQVLSYDIPLLGINFGHLGFLAEYGDLAVEDIATAILAHDLVIQERTVLKAELPSLSKTFYALNDVVIIRQPSANLLYTDLYIDNDLLHSFRSDGIVIATPTGSTAYALSAGGAVMDPNIRAFEIVPVAAHSLSSRAHVISDEQLIVLETRDNKSNFYLQADGQELVELSPGTKIVLSKAEYSLKLAKLKRSYRSFYSILRDKMKWGSIHN
jgi:NAD+ kinase